MTWAAPTAARGESAAAQPGARNAPEPSPAASREVSPAARNTTATEPDGQATQLAGTDQWFQLPAPSPDPASQEDIPEAASVGLRAHPDNLAPVPLAQVLAELARRAQCNFVDPGIAPSETIAYDLSNRDVDPWEAFTRIVQTRGYRIVYRDDVVTLVRNQEDSLKPAHLFTKRYKVYQGNLDLMFLQLERQGWNQVGYKQLVLSHNTRELVATAPESDLDDLDSTVHSKDFNPHTVKAEVWLEPSKSRLSERAGLTIALADPNVVPDAAPQMVRSLEPGNSERISLLDVQTERGASELGLTINTVLLPNGNLEAALGVENDAPSRKTRHGGTIRRATSHTVELSPTSQVIEVDGILAPPDETKLAQEPWVKRLFNRWTARRGTTRLVLKFSVEGTDSAVPRAPQPAPSPVSQPSHGGLATRK